MLNAARQHSMNGLRGPSDTDTDTAAWGAGCCDLVTVPARRGLEALDIMWRGCDGGVGPVLHDGGCDTLGFLVPPGTAETWDVLGSACTRMLTRGVTDGPPPVTGTCWLFSPCEVPGITDPGRLRSALREAARMIEAVDNCA